MLAKFLSNIIQNFDLKSIYRGYWNRLLVLLVKLYNNLKDKLVLFIKTWHYINNNLILIKNFNNQLNLKNMKYRY